MKIPEKETLRNMIIRHEGWRNEPYYCSEHVRTIGAGWNLNNPLPPEIDAYLKKNGRITDDHINELLDISLRHAWADCRVLFPAWDSFSDRRKFALIDFVFQLGFNKARRFIHSIACINTGRWEKAGEQMWKSRWAEQTPNRAKEVIEMIEVG